MVNDTRGPLRIVADDDHRWLTPESPIYIPPHLKLDSPGKLMFLKCHVRTVLRLEAVISGRGELSDLRRKFIRAGGDCICEQCGLKYYDHPNDIDAESRDDWSGSFLTILCNKSRVKL